MGFKRIYLGITWELPKIYLGFTGILLEFESMEFSRDLIM